MKKDNEEERKRIGILNKGCSNKFINNTFEGCDIGIQDEGRGTIAEGNRFLSVSDQGGVRVNWTKWGVVVGIMNLLRGILFR